MSLDSRLREILLNQEKIHIYDVYTLNIDKTLAQIKDALEEYDWVHIPQVEVVTRWEGNKKPEIFMINGNEVMTGSDWYQKFKDILAHEYDLRSPAFTSVQAIEAARKAAGIE